MGNKDIQANLRFGVGNIIKLFYRPHGLSGSVNSAQKSLKFIQQGSELTLINSSPYFISLTSLMVNGKRFPLDNPQSKMISPFGQYSWPIRTSFSSGSKVEWKVINDNGGIDAFDAIIL